MYLDRDYETLQEEFFGEERMTTTPVDNAGTSREQPHHKWGVHPEITV
jgi:hypothetical protein